VTRFDVVEADIAQLRSALEEGRVTSEDLVDAYLARIDAYDKEGPRLNALVVMNTSRASPQPDGRAGWCHFGGFGPDGMKTWSNHVDRVYEPQNAVGRPLPAARPNRSPS
jgi:hypothetical protein